MKRRSLLLLAAAGIPFFARAAEKKTETPLPPIAESVTVAITNVEVVVTDSKGRRVPGLKQEDFEVIEDGIPQRITNFYSVSGGRAILADGMQVALDDEEKAPDVPSPLKVKYVLYIDQLNLETLHRTRVFRSIYPFIEKTIGPNAEAMVVTFNRSLKVRQRFTTDRGAVAGTLQEIENESGMGNTITGERQDAIQRINDSKSQSEAVGIARQTSQSLDADLRLSIDALKTTIAGLAGIEGRKVLIYVSDGLPQMVGQELFDTIQRKYRTGAASIEGFSFDRTGSYAAIVQAAHAEGVTIDAIDAAGLAITEGVAAEFGTNENRGSGFASQQNMQAPLKMLADETGGIAAVNTNAPDRELTEIARDFSDFYSLGYRSTRGSIDRPHRIDVKVNRPGLRARYPSGYQEKTVETRTAEAVTAALFYPRTENPMNFSLAVGKPKAYGTENYLVPIKIGIPLQNVMLVPDGNAYKGRLYIYFVVLDSSGQQSDLQIRPLDIKVELKSYDSAKKKDYGYDVQLVMIPGGQKLSVAIRDSVSNAVSFAQKSVFVSVLPEETGKKGELGRN
jgi:VWFA-related protein